MIKFFRIMALGLAISGFWLLFKVDHLIAYGVFILLWAHKLEEIEFL